MSEYIQNKGFYLFQGECSHCQDIIKMDEWGNITGVEDDDKPYLQHGVKLIPCTVGMSARPGPQLKYLEILCLMCFNKIQMQSSGFFGVFLTLPHLPNVHVQKPSPWQMDILGC